MITLLRLRSHGDMTRVVLGERVSSGRQGELHALKYNDDVLHVVCVVITSAIRLAFPVGALKALGLQVALHRVPDLIIDCDVRTGCVENDVCC